jgi:hypothetical protein
MARLTSVLSLPFRRSADLNKMIAIDTVPVDKVPAAKAPVDRIQADWAMEPLKKGP